MHNALGLLGEQNAVFAIMLALGFAGIAAMFFALFVPGRWRVPYAAEVIFALIIFVLATGGAAVSQATVNEYWSDVPNIEEAAASGKIAIDYKAKPFDKAVSAYLYQWGFIFINPDGSATRNALAVKPGERVLVHVLGNDVIHGFQIPVVGLTTEVDPKAVRSVWFRAPKKAGKYLIQCMDYCGIGHHQMKAWLVVEGETADNEKEEKDHS
jgi:heme/copper-type cytochrome/quinol oxidase subunit 2